MSKFKYLVTIKRLSKEEGGGYLVEFPDLPGCVADGLTIEATLLEAEDALKSWLITAKKNEDRIPELTVIRQFSEQWRIRLPDNSRDPEQLF